MARSQLPGRFIPRNYTRLVQSFLSEPKGVLAASLTLIRRLSRGRNHGRMTEKPRWIARFAALATPRCRDLPGSIDRTIDRNERPVTQVEPDGLGQSPYVDASPTCGRHEIPGPAQARTHRARVEGDHRALRQMAWTTIERMPSPDLWLQGPERPAFAPTCHPVDVHGGLGR